MTTIPYGDPSFHGVDGFHQPERVPVGFLTQADNLDVQAGRMVVRPGKVGVLASALGSAIYNPTPVIQSDTTGSTLIWFAQGTGLRTYAPGATTTTAITLPGSVSLTAANVRIHQAASYVYVSDNSTYSVGGVNSGLLRFLPDGSGGAVFAGLTKPNTPSPVTLGHLSFAGLSAPAALTWNSDGLTSLANLVTGTNNNPTSSNTGATGSGKYWIESSSGTFTFQAMPSDATINGLRLSGTGTAFVRMLAPVAVGASTAGTHPNVFQVLLSAETQPNTGNNPSRMTWTMYAYDSGGTTVIGQQSVDIGPISGLRDYTATFDFRGLDVRFISLQLGDDNPFTTGAFVGADPVFRNIRVEAGDWKFNLPSGAAALTVGMGSVYASPSGDVTTNGSITAMTPQFQTTAIFTRGHQITTAISSTDLSASQRMTANLTLTYPATDFVPVRLFIKDNGGNFAYGPMTPLTAQQATVVDFDLTVAPIGFDLTKVVLVGIEFGDDIPTDGYAGYYRTTPTTAPAVLTVTSISLPGNLTPGTSITYRLVEIDASTDPTNLLNVLQSDGSDLTAAVVPTVSDSQATITLLARANGTATYWALYRFGDYTDGLGRLLAYEKWDVAGNSFVAPNDTNKGTAPYFAALANPYVSVSFPASAGLTGTVITDNTPSSFLLTTPNYIGGRDAPPTKVREITDFQGRLCLLAGEGRRSELYMSWLLSADSNAGLYFSRTVDPTDPDAAIKGFYVHIGTQDNDRALRIITLVDRMVFLFERKAPFVLLGTDPPNYQIRPFLAQSTSLGLSSRDAAMLYGNAIVYLTVDGLVRWDTENAPQPFSLPIQSFLNPAISYLRTAALNAGAYALCSLWQHGGRLYLAAPGISTDTANTVIYRFDPKEGAPAGAIQGDYAGGAWSKWNQGNVTGGCALTGAGTGDMNGHYVAGLDGQIYLYTDAVGDKATSGGSESGIAWALATRQYGEDDTYADKGTVRYDGDFQSISTEPAGVVLTIGANSTSGPAVWSATYTLTASNDNQHASLRPTIVQGRTIGITVSGTVKRRFSIGQQRMQVSPGSQRRQ